jgi:hypothetical protein
MRRVEALERRSGGMVVGRPLVQLGLARVPRLAFGSARHRIFARMSCGDRGVLAGALRTLLGVAGSLVGRDRKRLTIGL